MQDKKKEIKALGEALFLMRSSCVWVISAVFAKKQGLLQKIVFLFDPGHLSKS